MRICQVGFFFSLLAMLVWDRLFLLFSVFEYAFDFGASRRDMTALYTQAHSGDLEPFLQSPIVVLIVI